MDPKTLRQLEQIINNALTNVATKNDLKSFATKVDIKDFATKDDLQSFATKDDLQSFATKDDLQSFPTKEDIKPLATKRDLDVLKKELISYTDEWCADIVTAVNKNKADETEVQRLKIRVRNLERKVALS